MHILASETTYNDTDDFYKRSDWDASTVSVYIPTDHAIMALKAFGWTQNDKNAWVSPHGAAYWHADEALRVAISAFALSMDTLGNNQP